MSLVTVVQHPGHWAEIRLDRPEAHNAISTALAQELAGACATLATDPAVRAVVLASSSPKAFCVGADLKERVGFTDAQLIDQRPVFRRAFAAVRELPMPSVAAVHGHALGGGLQIALGADIRIVAPDAKLSVLEIRWGLVPDMTGTAALIRLTGEDVAKELTFTGRTVDGEEAVRLGLATRTADAPHAAAVELARDIASKSPDAIRGAKRLLNSAGENDLAEQFLEESRTLGELRGSPNQVEAVRAYFEKRAPAFTDPS